MDKNITPLHLAAQFGQFALVKYICDNTWNVRPQRSFDGAFPLSLAISRGQIRIAKLLIQNDLYNIVHDFFMRIKTISWLIKMELLLLLLAFLLDIWLGFHKYPFNCDLQNVMATLVFDLPQVFWFSIFLTIFLFVTAQIFFWIMLFIADVLFSYFITPILDQWWTFDFIVFT